MKRIVIALAVLLLLPASLSAQQGRRTPADSARRAAEQARRDSLEAEIVQKFLGDLTRELRLDAAQRGQIETVLKESGTRRRALMRTSFDLRGRMHRALRDRNTNDADFAKLLTEYEQLRVREHDLWRRDQEDLARFLTIRQRTQFLIHWANFQERVRDILDQKIREQRGGGARPDHPRSAAH